MRKIAIICLTVACTSILCTGIVRAFSVGSGVLEVDALKVGKQGVGGVTYFNGTLINETTDAEGNGIPVTYGDDVRIDGGIWRGTKLDTQPVMIYDELQVWGEIEGADIKIGLEQESVYDFMVDSLERDTTHLTNINAFYGMFDCLADYAEIYPEYIPTSKWIGCWNNNMVGISNVENATNR